MNCPRCRQPLVAVEHEGIELDWCVGCGGLWFDEGELALLAERYSRRFSPADLGSPAGVEHGETTLRCPRCRQPMEKVLAGAPPAVWADRCRRHGLWLDRDELGKVLGRPPAGGRSDEAVVLRFVGETFEGVAGPAAEGGGREEVER